MDNKTTRVGVFPGFSVEVAVCVIAIAVFSVVIHALPISRESAHWWANSAWTIASLLAALRCLQAARHLDETERKAWRWFGVGCLAWFLGMLAWSCDELIRGYLTPFPAISDAGFLGMAALFMLGLLTMRAAAHTAALTLIQVSKLGILICSLLIAHIIILAGPITGKDFSAVYLATSVGYPVLYMSAVFFGILILLQGSGRVSRPLLLLVAGLAVHAFTDTLYAYDLLMEGYQVGNVLDAFWLAGFALIYLAAGERMRHAATVANDSSESIPDGRALHFDVTLPIGALLFVVAVGFLFRHNLSVDTLFYLIPVGLVMVFFFGLREYATYRYESRINQQLLNSQQHSQRLLETIPYGVQEIDRHGYITYTNPAHDKLYGYGQGEMRGMAAWSLVADVAGQENLRQYLRRIVDVRIEPEPFVSMDRKKDGSLIMVQSDWDYRCDAQGNVTGFISILTDITERRRAEESLRQAAAVFESTLEGVMVTDAGGVIVAVNSAFERITGYSGQEAVGHKPSILQSERQSQDFYRNMWQTLRSEGIWRGEVWNRRKNGEIFPVIQSISSICDDRGAVTHYVSLFSDISALKESQQKLNHLAYHDALTDLPNRLLFEDRLQHAMAHARREGHAVGLLFIDLDRFKNINDSLGHPVGDALLLETAARIKAMARREDTVARLGGDEFVVIMEKIQEPEDAAVLAQKLIDGFHRPVEIKGHMLHVGLSIGIGVYPRDGEDVATLVRNADAALYRVKEQGRNGFQFYTHELTATVSERLRLETGLRRALASQEFELHYQPQVDLASGAVIAAEALLRWRNPEGDTPREKIIALAEETGLIVPIGEWVLYTACRQMADWRRAGLPLQRMAVNVSGLQLQRGNVIECVRNALAQTQLPAQCLEIEFTENYIMHTTERAIGQLSWLKEQGITLTIDDFGTGYSSLSYLKRLPIDRIKIDRSFVRDIPQDRNDEAITSAILAMAHSLDIDVVAEGVETRQQQEFLLSRGCREGQGYLFSHPLPAGEFERFSGFSSRSAAGP